LESAIRALQALGLKPDPSENEKLSAIAAGEPVPPGDAEREYALSRQIFSAAWNRQILTRFERQPRPKDVAAQLRALAKASRSGARTLRGLGKRSIALMFSGNDLDDRFARLERFDGHPGRLSRLQMLQVAGVEQELASVLASLAREAAMHVGGDVGLVARLAAFADAQERLCAAWRWPALSDPAMERLFDATPLWALSRQAEKIESNPAFWRALGPVAAAPTDFEAIRHQLLEKARIVADHADVRERAFVAAWPIDKGGFSPLVGSESFERISSHPGAAYDRLLHAVAEMASGEKPAKKAFSDVLAKVPGICDAVLDRPCAEERHKSVALTRQTESEQKAAQIAEREAISAAEYELALPIPRTGGELGLRHNEVKRWLIAIRNAPGQAAATKAVALEERRKALLAAAEELSRKI
jgi:hypothetical protein